MYFSLGPLLSSYFLGTLGVLNIPCMLHTLFGVSISVASVPMAYATEGK